MSKNIKLNLSKEEIDILKEYALLHCESGVGNLCTAFPTIHIVRKPIIEYSTDESKGDMIYLLSFEFKKSLIFKTLEEVINHVDEILEMHNYDDFDLTQRLRTCKNIDTFNDIIDELIGSDELEEDCPLKIEQLYCQTDYKEVAYFFLRSEAEKYLEYQSHNLPIGSHVYTSTIGYSNKGDLPIIGNLLVKLGNEIIENESKEE